MTQNAIVIDGIANGTISKGQFLKYASGGWVACSAITDPCQGIAFGDAVAGGAVGVQVGGIVQYLVAGADVADGAKIGPSTGGAGQTAVTTQFPRIQAYGAGKAGGYARGLWISDVTVL